MTRWNRYPTGGLLSQRGLSLVEIMIILVVVGLLLGASVVPIRSLWQGDAYAQERERMAALQEAIIGYAASNRTKERIVVVTEGGANSRTFILPAGRPYLPCPDINGDGHEDRALYHNPGGAPYVPEATVYVDLAAVPPRNGLLVIGNCAVTRGSLPWKTLGTPPADYWGSRYTYQVDDIFSNALIGFNQDTAIDSFDYRRVVEIDSDGDIQYRYRESSELLSGYFHSRRPIVVCDGGRVTLCQEGGILQLEAGRRATVDFETPRRFYRDGDVIEGLPYVIVSHGDNRYGAVNHVVNFEDSYASGLVCNWPINSSSVYGIPDYLRHEAVNFPLVETLSAPSSLRGGCAPLTYGGNPIQNGFFVTQPRAQPFPFINSDSGDTFDDIVVWQTRQELTRHLTDAGILPAKNFPVLRLY